MAEEITDTCENTYLLTEPTATRSLVGCEGKWKASTSFILVSVVIERTAFYSLQGSLVYFLSKEPLCWTPQEATTASYAICGIAYFLSVIAGATSDFAMSPFYSILTGYVLYILGYSLAPIHGFITDGVNATTRTEEMGCDHMNYTIASLCPATMQPPCVVSVYSAITLVAIGSSFLRSCVAAFGADQVREQGLSVTRSFFGWYYWCANLGSFVAYSTTAYLQRTVGFGSGFMTPLLMLLLSALIFVAGSRIYCNRPVNRAAIGDFFAIIRVALAKSQARRSGETSSVGCFECAKVIHGGSYSAVAVDKVKTTGRILLVLVLMLPYWVTYSRIMSTFPQQGLHMSTGSSNLELQVPPMFNDVGLMIALPLCNLVIYPQLGRLGIRVTMYKRISVGMLICVLCLVTAGVVELCRFNSIQSGHQQLIVDTYYNVSSLSIYWQIPQYLLLGASEAFAIVSAMEFTYILSPRSMQCIMMGTFWMFLGLGDLFNLLLPSIPDFRASALRTDFQNYFYFVLAAALFCTTVVFALIGLTFDLGLDTLTIAALRPVLDSPIQSRRALRPETVGTSQDTAAECTGFYGSLAAAHGRLSTAANSSD